MAKKEKPVVKTTTVYIGKSLPGLPRNMAFKGGVLPEYVRQMAEQNENIAGLIVPVDRLAEARKNINQKGHILNYYAEKLNKEDK